MVTDVFETCARARPLLYLHYSPLVTIPSVSHSRPNGLFACMWFVCNRTCECVCVWSQFFFLTRPHHTHSRKTLTAAYFHDREFLTGKAAVIVRGVVNVSGVSVDVDWSATISMARLSAFSVYIYIYDRFRATVLPSDQPSPPHDPLLPVQKKGEKHKFCFWCFLFVCTQYTLYTTTMTASTKTTMTAEKTAYGYARTLFGLKMCETQYRNNRIRSVIRTYYINI